MKIRDLQRLTDDVLMKYGNIEIQIFDPISRSWKNGVEAGASNFPMPYSVAPIFRLHLQHQRPDCDQAETAEELFQRARKLVEQDKQREAETDLAAEYRRFWDEAALLGCQVIEQLADDPSGLIRVAAKFADELTDQRAQRFGTKDGPTFIGFCTCGNRLVCDKCHCSPSTCKCKEAGHTGI
jgi:hypothetical protein